MLHLLSEIPENEQIRWNEIKNWMDLYPDLPWISIEKVLDQTSYSREREELLDKELSFR